MKLYTYFRSSAAYRVRIALHLKGIAYDSVPVHLLQDGGQQLLPAYRAVNPSALVPALDDDGTILTQSLAMLEYLDETRPGVPLLPADAPGRARVRALALAIACDAHPLTNLRVLKYLKGTLGLSEEVKQEWYRHWMAEGLAAVEACWRRAIRPARPCIAMATGRPWRTAAWCRRYSMRSASPSTWRRIRAWRASMRIAPACRPLPLRIRRSSPTPNSFDAAAMRQAPPGNRRGFFMRD